MLPSEQPGPIRSDSEPILPPSTAIHAPGPAPTGHTLTASGSELPLTERQIGLVDDRSDEIMAQQSVEGQPPTHRQRMRSWKFLALIAGILVFFAIALAISNALAMTEIALGAILVICTAILGGWPVWGAGMLRGREERSAHTEAVIEVRHDATVLDATHADGARVNTSRPAGDPGPDS